MRLSHRDNQPGAQSRLGHLIRFYRILDAHERRIGGRRLLSDCNGRTDWPERGVYFFMEPGEERTDSGHGLRIVRVGTHALRDGSKSTLWRRLRQHRGTAKSGGGNHRGSVFRLLVGSTLVKQAQLRRLSWGEADGASKAVRKAEQPIEVEVSKIIGAMPFLWLAVDDAPGPGSLRGYVERNSIALLSNFGKHWLDPPSQRWRGRVCDHGKGRVMHSGLWNQNHVDERYDPAFLDVLTQLAERR